MNACVLNGEEKNVARLIGHFNPSDPSVCPNSKGFKEAFDGFFEKAEKMISDENFSDSLDQLNKEREFLKRYVIYYRVNNCKLISCRGLVINFFI